MRGLMLLLLVLATQSSAQVMVIHRSDGTTQRIPVSDIAKITFDLDATSANWSGKTSLKMKSMLANILPNPFFTRVSYTLEDESQVNIAVFDVQGKMVRSVLSGHTQPGSHLVDWDATDNSGQKVAPGPYLIRVEIAGQVQSKTLFIVN